MKTAAPADSSRRDGKKAKSRETRAKDLGQEPGALWSLGPWPSVSLARRPATVAMPSAGQDAFDGAAGKLCGAGVGHPWGDA